jgi:uncharacterized protein (DUF2141 family)
MSRLFISLSTLSILMVGTLTFFSCGQPMPPTGGPRDTLPPVLVKAQPGDSTTNFQGNRIVLEFDEYVQLENPFEKLGFSPVPKVRPQAEARLKTVTIRIKDTLEPNTTYSIDFGDALKDINESNVLRNLTYVFSTGGKIDSGVIRGRVFIAENGKTDSTMVVLLHRNPEDSAVAKEKPRYTAKVRSDGQFLFRYLAPGDYRIYALKDADGSLKYDQKSELIGYREGTVKAGDTDPVILYAFAEAEETRKTVATPATTPQGPSRPKEDKRLRVGNNLEGPKLDLLGDLVLSFENRLRTLDTGRIRLTDERFQTIADRSFLPDSSGLKLAIRHPWTPGKAYRLVLEKEFATDTLGNRFIKTDTLEFSAKENADYGSLRINVRNLDTSRRPVLLIYKEDRLEKSQPLKQSRYEYRLFRPGEYGIRILFDDNGNGMWDTGDFRRRRQPEVVVERKQKLTIRPNWDNEFEVDLSGTER